MTFVMDASKKSTKSNADLKNWYDTLSLEKYQGQFLNLEVFLTNAKRKNTDQEISRKRQKQ